MFHLYLDGLLEKPGMFLLIITWHLVHTTIKHAVLIRNELQIIVKMFLLVEVLRKGSDVQFVLSNLSAG